MRIEPLRPLGVRVEQLAVADVGAEAAAELAALLAEHGVLVLPDQQVDDAGFTAFLRAFGPAAFTVGETPVPGHPDLNLISNVGRDRPPRSRFHVDTSYLAQPPAYTALRAVRVPQAGGATLFSDQYRAAADLPPDLREAVEGLDDAAGAALVARLLAHATREDNVLTHHWRPGDVVMWDNAAVMHRADHSAVDGDRVMHRGMVAAHLAPPPAPHLASSDAGAQAECSSNARR